MLSLLFGRWAHIYSSSILLSLLAFQRLYVIPVLDRERRGNCGGRELFRHSEVDLLVSDVDLWDQLVVGDCRIN